MDESESSLPPGFRFYPTEEELISFYLNNKLNGTRPDIDPLIPLVDIYDYDPWELPQIAGQRCREDEMSEQWFFFVPRRQREVRGGRANRLTNRGYWKATGSPGGVYSTDPNRVVGWKRTMVFYIGRAPYGRKTAWKMNEYKAAAAAVTPPSHVNYSEPQINSSLILRDELSLCRIYKKSKCVRSFDRRPPPPKQTEVTGGHQAAVAHHHLHQLSINEVATTSHNQVLNMNQLPNIAIDNYSPVSWPSGDQMAATNINLSDENNTGELVKDYRVNNDDLCQPSWDWDQINYWLDLQN